MHQNILLVTPVLRFNNLKHILKNIKDVFKEEKDITPWWVLCIDQYNCNLDDSDLQNLIKACTNVVIPVVYYQGKPGCENYGGTLINVPLNDLKNNWFKNDNPLMILLDDDNILSPHLLTFIHNHCMNDENNIWILNMLSECGDIRFNRGIDFLSYRPNNSKYCYYHTCSTIDPSQILFRLDLFLEIGGFGTTKFYDFSLMTKISNNYKDIQKYLRFQMDDLVLPSVPARCVNFYISTYHNGLITDEMINKTIDDIKTCDFDDSYIRVHVKDNYYNIQLSNDELKEILEKRISHK